MSWRNLQIILFTFISLSLPLLTTGKGKETGENKSPTGETAVPDTVILVSGNEQQQLNLSLPDGGLPPMPGVLNIQLLRTTRDAPLLADGDGWTYAHHMDLSEWRGRLYAAWNMTLKDEDVPPSKVVYATSADGIDWSKPADLFPRDLAWACRFYFYHTQNDKMLAFCAARLSDGIVTENLKSVLLVREILPDHRLGKVFTLIHPMEKMPPFFESSDDNAFVMACREAVGNTMLLEQQDYGVFLGDRKMIWHDKTPPYKGFYKFGKALSFFRRLDQQWIGISKMGFVTQSADEGKSWSEPVLPSTLIAGAAKIWGQQTNDNHYILAYNPDPKREKRFPLIMVNGIDGQHFKDMRVIHGEFPPLRYPGKYKDFGYQYIRGVAPWSTDHSFADKSAIWLIYSVHKEDVWLSRIPLPLKTEPASSLLDDFQDIIPGALIRNWNIYSPKWAPVRVVKEPGKSRNLCLELRDGDPTDYARAMRLFSASDSIEVKFRIKPLQTNASLEVEIQNEHGSPSLCIQFTKEGSIKATANQKVALMGNYLADKWLSFNITTNQKTRETKITFNRNTLIIPQIGKESDLKSDRLIFRTGGFRKLGDTGHLIEGEDKPLINPALFLLDDVAIIIR